MASRLRRALRWCYGVGGRAWLFEVRSFLSRLRRRQRGITLDQFWGSPQDAEEEALRPKPLGHAGLPEVGSRRAPPSGGQS